MGVVEVVEADVDEVVVCTPCASEVVNAIASKATSHVTGPEVCKSNFRIPDGYAGSKVILLET